MSTLQTCACERALARLAEWVENAQQSHAKSGCGRELMGRLWVLYGELSYAMDHCPNAVAHSDELVLDRTAAQARAAQG